MKVKVKEVETEIECVKYPCLMIADSGLIILMLKHKTGTVLVKGENDSNVVGEHYDGWVMDCFPMNLNGELHNFSYISTIVLSRNAVYHKYISLLQKSLKDSNRHVDIWVYCEKTSQQCVEVEVNELLEHNIDAYITDYPIQCKNVISKLSIK